MMDSEDSEALEPSSSQVFENDDVYIPPDESSSIEVASSNIFHPFRLEDNNSEADVIESRNGPNECVIENVLALQTDNVVSDTNHNNISPSVAVADASFNSNFVLEPQNCDKPMVVFDNDSEPGCSSSSSNLNCSSNSRYQPVDLLGSEALSNTDDMPVPSSILVLPCESEAHSSNNVSQFSKQADSNCLEKSKHKGGKGVKGKRRFNLNLQHNNTPEESSRQVKEEKPIQYAEPANPRLQPLNKHSLFAKPLIITTNNENRSFPSPSYDSDSSNDDVFVGRNVPVQTSSPCHNSKKSRISLNEEESFMVASSSEGIQVEDTFYVKSPKTSSDALVSSSTGQLDQLPESSINFQVNDISNSSSLIPSPINPPVLDSTVDSTSGQNVASPFSEMDEDDLDFHCPLDSRNEISTSESHIADVVIREPNVPQQPTDSRNVSHYLEDYMNLGNLNSSALNNDINAADNDNAEASALIPTSSAFLRGSSSALSNNVSLSSSKSFPGPSDDTSDAPSPPDSENLNNLAANESMTFPVDTSTSDVRRQNILDMPAIEVPSSSLASTSSNFPSETFDASGSADGGLNSSTHNYRSSRTLAQINEDYLLGIVEESMSSEDALTPGEQMPAGSLQLNEGECLQTESEDDESSHNFQDSLELGLVPQNLGPFVASRSDQQILIPPTNLLESSHMEFMDCSQSFEVEQVTHSSHVEQLQPMHLGVSEQSGINKVPSISSNFDNINGIDHVDGSSQDNSLLLPMNATNNLNSDFDNDVSGQHQIISLENLQPEAVNDGVPDPLHFISESPSASTPNSMNSRFVPKISIASPSSSLPSTSRILSSLHSPSVRHETVTEHRNSSSSSRQAPVNIHSLFNNKAKCKMQVCESEPPFDPDDPDDPDEDNDPKILKSLFNKSLKPESFNGQNKIPISENSNDPKSSNVPDQNAISMENRRLENVNAMNCDENYTARLPDQISNEVNHKADIGFWCSDCEKFLKSKCPIHRIQTIMDKPILSRAWASLPAQHLLIKQTAIVKDSMTATYGVFCRKSIPKRTQFGPLEGTFSDIEPRQSTLLFRSFQGQRSGFIDVSDEATSNWMRFVRIADTYLEMNCIVIEEDKNVYFLTTTNLLPKAELRVGYSKQYAVKYGYSTLTPTEEEQKILDQLRKTWSCYECEDSFETSLELQNHLTTHDDIDIKPERKLRKRGRVKRTKHESGSSKKVKGAAEEMKLEQDENSPSNRFECSQCQLCFLTSELLDLHSFVHSTGDVALQDQISNNNNDSDSDNEKTDKKLTTYTCPQCSLTSGSTKEIGEHVKQHSFLVAKNSSANPYKCGFCYKSYNSKERLDSHSNTHKDEWEKPHACWLCLRRFCTQSALGSHIKFHADGAMTLYNCPICNAKIDNVSDFKLHFPTHCIDGFYTCPTCSKKFPTYFKIRRHIRSYHPTMNYQCHHCGKQMPSVQKLRFHLAIHSDKREFGCHLCPKRFNRKDKMKEHLKRIHTHKREEPKRKLANKFVPKVDPTDYRQFTYKCDQCMLGFKRRGMLVNHMSKRHPNIPVSSVPELNKPIIITCQTFSCQYCGKSYASMTKRKHHIIKNHPGMEVPSAKCAQTWDVSRLTFAASCDLCPRQYMTKAKLLQHQRKAHPQDHQNSEEAPGGSSDQPHDILAQAMGKFSPEFANHKEEEIGDAPSIIVSRESISAVLNSDGSLSLRPLYSDQESPPEVSCPVRIPVESGQIIVRNSSIEAPISLDNLKTPSLVVWQPSIAFNSSNM